MNLHVSRAGVAGLLVTTLVALVLFVVLMGRFGGPSVHLSRPYRVTATFPDTKSLAVRSDVLVRGVRVGRVERIRLGHGTATVTFDVDADAAPLHRGATVRVGEKTLLGESDIDLDPGRRTAPVLPDGVHLPAAAVRPAAVEIDEALNALDPTARRHVKAMLGTFAEGAGDPRTSARIGAALDGLSRTTGALRTVADLLASQRADITQGVETGRVVFGQLADREAAVRGIVHDGRATLGALAARDAGLRAGLRALPPLLARAEATLRDARPFLRDGRPTLADLRRAAGPLTTALRALPPVTASADRIVGGLPRFDAAALPLLATARGTLAAATPVARSLPPALRNAVTVVRYLDDHHQPFAAWFSNTAGIGAQHDAKGHFARFGIFLDPGTVFGGPTSAGRNPYTGPGDALANRPDSGYPRLQPYAPRPAR